MLSGDLGANDGARGFRRITDLSIAMANDFDLSAMLQTAAAAMTTPKLETLRQQSSAALLAENDNNRLCNALEVA